MESPSSSMRTGIRKSLRDNLAPAGTERVEVYCCVGSIIAAALSSLDFAAHKYCNKLLICVGPGSVCSSRSSRCPTHPKFDQVDDLEIGWNRRDMPRAAAKLFGEHSRARPCRLPSLEAQIIAISDDPASGQAGLTDSAWPSDTVTPSLFTPGLLKL